MPTTIASPVPYSSLPSKDQVNTTPARAGTSHPPISTQIRPLLAAFDEAITEHAKHLLAVPDLQARDSLLLQAQQLDAEVAGIRQAIGLPRTQLHVLPVAILSRIFEEAVTPQNLPPGGDCAAPSSRMAFTLSHASSRWREVALSTPSLWAVVPVEVRKRGSFELMATCFERSQDVALAVTLDFTTRDRSLTPANGRVDISAAQRAFLAALLAKRHRVAELTLVLRTDEQRTTAAECLRSVEMPRLEKLVVRNSSRGNPHNGHRQQDVHGSTEVMLGGAPLLRTINFQGCALEAFCPPLRGVASITVDTQRESGHGVREICRLLLRVESLRQLDLASVSLALDKDNTPIAPVELPSLESLSVSTAAARLCEHLTAPSLRVLTIHSAISIQEQSELLASWSRIKPSQYPALAELNLIEFSFSTSKVGVFERLFRSFPFVCHLRLSLNPWSIDRAFAALSGLDPSGSLLLPCLQRVNTDAVSRAALTQLITACAGGSARRSPFRTLVCHPGFVRALVREHEDYITWMAAQGVALEEAGKGCDRWLRSWPRWTVKPAPKFNRGAAGDPAEGSDSEDW